MYCCCSFILIYVQFVVISTVLILKYVLFSPTGASFHLVMERTIMVSEANQAGDWGGKGLGSTKNRVDMCCCFSYCEKFISTQ